MQGKSSTPVPVTLLVTTTGNVAHHNRAHCFSYTPFWSATLYIPSVKALNTMKIITFISGMEAAQM